MARNFKKELLTILDRTQVEVNRFNNLISGIEHDFDTQLITSQGREKRLNALLDETGNHIEELKKEALEIVDSGMQALKSSWDRKTVEAYSDAGLSNIVTLINNGAIPTEEELQALMKQYEENPSALEMLKKALDKNGAVLQSAHLGAETPKQRTERCIAQLRRNFSERYHNRAITDLPTTIEGLRDFLTTRVVDDLTVLPIDHEQ